MIEYPYTFTLAHLPIKLNLITDKWLKELFDVANPDEIKALLGIDEPALEEYFSMHESGFGSYSSQMAYFLIEEKENGRKLGECGFHSWNPQHAKAEVFYKLFDDGDK
jgi:ribosomal-protein-alanine N-acetyltransferase